jgi:HNH endonuclease
MKTLEERFWEKVDKNGPIPEHRPDLGPCWIWTAGKSKQGYGMFYVPSIGNMVTAHDFAWELLRGPLPDKIIPDHLCRVRCCVNVGHLDPVTHRVNILRGTGYSARHAAQTHCIHGHEFTPENTWIRKGKNRANRRECRQCHRRDVRRYKQLQKSLKIKVALAVASV